MSSVSLSRRRTVFGKFLVIPCCWSFHSVLLKSNIQFLFIISLYISSVAFITGLFNMFGNILLSLLFSVVLSSIKYIHSFGHFRLSPKMRWKSKQKLRYLTNGGFAKSFLWPISFTWKCTIGSIPYLRLEFAISKFDHGLGAFRLSPKMRRKTIQKLRYLTNGGFAKSFLWPISFTWKCTIGSTPYIPLEFAISKFDYGVEAFPISP